jgi:hypothetical protein
MCRRVPTVFPDCQEVVLDLLLSRGYLLRCGSIAIVRIVIAHVISSEWEYKVNA